MKEDLLEQMFLNSDEKVDEPNQKKHIPLKFSVVLLLLELFCGVDTFVGVDIFVEGEDIKEDEFVDVKGVEVDVDVVKSIKLVMALL